jgi:hypothetical protein
VIELQEKMNALNKAILPDRLKKREASFLASRKVLSQSVAALDTSMVQDKLKEFASKVEVMHADYQALEKVFE